MDRLGSPSFVSPSAGQTHTLPSPPQLSDSLSLHQWLPNDTSFGYPLTDDPLYVGIDHPDIFADEQEVSIAPYTSASATHGPSQWAVEHGTQTVINSIDAPEKNGLHDSVVRDNVQLEVVTGEQDVPIDVENEIRPKNEEDGNCGETDSFAAEVDTMLQALIETTHHRQTGIPLIGTRVNIEHMAEIDNPLEKDGRNTVIRGRLRHDHPYAQAANILGLRLVSQEYAPKSVSSASDRSLRDRLRLFLLDCNAVHRSAKRHDIKVPVIGGGPLDLFQLQREVLLLGGLQNVVEKRAFRIVAQQLELPSTCTSAAYVLKGTYERFLYQYEQLLVFGRKPQNTELVNMKQAVSETRKRGRRASRSSVRPSSASRSKRRHADIDDDECGDPDVVTSPVQITDGTQKRRRANSSNGSRACAVPPEANTAGAQTWAEFLATFSSDPTATWNLYCHLTGEDDGDFNLPRWALELPGDEACEALIRAARNIEKCRQARSMGEIIVLAVVECLEVDEAKYGQFASLGLARLICCAPPTVCNGRKAQSLLFSLLLKLMSGKRAVLLAANSSGKGILDGIFTILHNFYQMYMRSDTLEGSSTTEEGAVNLDSAACFCALQILDGLARQSRNYDFIVAHRAFIPLCCQLLRASNLPRSHLLALSGVLNRFGASVRAVEDTDVFRVVVNSAVSRVGSACCFPGSPEIPGSHLKPGTFDYAMSDAYLRFLTSCAPAVAQGATADDQGVSRLVQVVARILAAPECVVSLQSTLDLAFLLVTAAPAAMRKNSALVWGLFAALRDPSCSKVGAAILTRLHSTQSISDFAAEFFGPFTGSTEEQQNSASVEPDKPEAPATSQRVVNPNRKCDPPVDQNPPQNQNVSGGETISNRALDGIGFAHALAEGGQGNDVKGNATPQDPHFSGVDVELGGEIEGVNGAMGNVDWRTVERQDSIFGNADFTNVGHDEINEDGEEDTNGDTSGDNNNTTNIPINPGTSSGEDEDHHEDENENADEIARQATFSEGVAISTGEQDTQSIPITSNDGAACDFDSVLNILDNVPVGSGVDAPTPHDVATRVQTSEEITPFNR